MVYQDNISPTLMDLTTAGIGLIISVFPVFYRNSNEDVGYTSSISMDARYTFICYGAGAVSFAFWVIYFNSAIQNTTEWLSDLFVYDTEPFLVPNLYITLSPLSEVIGLYPRD